MTVKAGGSGDNPGVLELVCQDATGSGRHGEIRFGNMDGTSTITAMSSIRAFRTASSNTSSALSFWTSNSGTMSNKMTISHSGVISGDFSDTSDGRLKENIVKLKNDALSKIKELNPVEFSWKENNRNAVGFVAQDIEKIFPKLVYEHETPELSDMKTIKTAGILAYAVKAIQELTEKVETQEKELALLRG